MQHGGHTRSLATSRAARGADFIAVSAGQSAHEAVLPARNGREATYTDHLSSRHTQMPAYDGRRCGRPLDTAPHGAVTVLLQSVLSGTSSDMAPREFTGQPNPGKNRRVITLELVRNVAQGLTK